METRIKKWGKCMGISIPDRMLKDLKLENGSPVDIRTVNDKIIIKSKRSLSLAEMLKKINRKNLHGESDIGTPVGKEIW